MPTASAGDKVLAADIRSFVAAMPAVETRRDIIKRRLEVQFSHQVEAVRARTPEQNRVQNPEQKNSAEQSAPRGPEMDV